MEKKVSKYFTATLLISGCAISTLLREHAVQIIKAKSTKIPDDCIRILFFSSVNKLARKNMLRKSDNASKLLLRFDYRSTGIESCMRPVALFHSWLKPRHSKNQSDANPQKIFKLLPLLLLLVFWIIFFAWIE